METLDKMQTRFMYLLRKGPNKLNPIEYYEYNILNSMIGMYDTLGDMLRMLNAFKNIEELLGQSILQKAKESWNTKKQ